MEYDDVIDTTGEVGLDPVEAFIADLNKKILANPQRFVMPSMSSVTVKEASGQYRKRPVTAGATFVVIGIYAGKRSPVFTFKGDIPYEHELVEFNQLDAFHQLQGFSQYVTGLISEDFPTALNRVKREAKKVERQVQAADVKEKAQNNALWGSW